MKSQNYFSDINVKKVAEKVELEAYPEDLKEIERFINHKKQELGGEIVFAEVLNKMVRSLRSDPSYAASLGDHPLAPKGKRNKNPLKESQMDSV